MGAHPNLKPSPNSVRYRLVGKCVLPPLLVFTLSTTTPRQRHGTTPVFPRGWTPTFLSTSATLGGSLYISAVNLPCECSLVTVRSRSDEITFSRIAMQKS